jgi:hypothetical protein
MIRANADMTEGRGPMKIVGITTHKHAAIAYALQQPGIMGCKNMQRGVKEPFNLCAFDYPTMKGTMLVYGDWEVIEFDID